MGVIQLCHVSCKMYVNVKRKHMFEKRNLAKEKKEKRHCGGSLAPSAIGSVPQAKITHHVWVLACQTVPCKRSEGSGLAQSDHSTR